MADERLHVLHLVAADTPAEHLDLLRCVGGVGASGGGARVFHCGPGTRRAALGVSCARVHAAGPWSPLRAAALQRGLQRVGFQADRPVVFHAWSTVAACWALPLTAGHRPLLVQVDPAAKLATLARWAAAQNAHFVCASSATRQRLLDRGVPAARVVVVCPACTPPPPDPAARGRGRARLALRPDDEAVLALPPVARPAGALSVAWAAFLLEKARPRVRLVLPADGREAARIQRLAAACRHEWMVRYAPADLPLATLLAAADVAVYLPHRDAPPQALWSARATRCRLVATDVPVVREVLAGRAGVWLCRPGDPEDAARRLTAALESEAPRTVEGRHAPRANSPARLVAEYEQVYARLASRRPAAEPGS